MILHDMLSIFVRNIQMNPCGFDIQHEVFLHTISKCWLRQMSKCILSFTLKSIHKHYTDYKFHKLKTFHNSPRLPTVCQRK